MKVLIKQAVIHKVSGHAGERGSLLINNGVIESIGDVAQADYDEVIDEDGLHVSAGWFDPFVNFCEPGNEYKEDLTSGIEAAQAGGFTTVGLLPDTDPIIDNRPQLDFLTRTQASAGIQLLVGPSFVKASSTNELSEILELNEAGAFAFNAPAQANLASSVVLKAMEYSKVTGKKIVLSSTDHTLIPGAFMHEGQVNVTIGLRGIPAFSEELQVKAYIELLRYTGASLHLSGVTAARSLPLIENAKKEGLKLSCDTTVYHLLYNDEAIKTFNTNYKLSSPLRSETDRKALFEAVNSGLIDVVTSYHQPHDDDVKKTEIRMAEPGVIGIQTLFPLLQQAVGLERAVYILAHANAKAFGLENNGIEVGQKANLTLFFPDKKWQLNNTTNKSKSTNTMVWEQELTGSAWATMVGNKINKV